MTALVLAAMEHMTPLELWATRQFLGLSNAELASLLEVEERAVARWSAGDRPITEARAKQLNDLVALSSSHVAAAVRNSAESGVFQIPTDPVLPEGWWLQVAVRARLELPGLRILEPEGGTSKGRRR